MMRNVANGPVPLIAMLAELLAREVSRYGHTLSLRLDSSL